MPETKAITIPNVVPEKINFNIYQKIIDSVFRPMTLGRLNIDLPEGNTLVYGDGQAGISARIRVNNYEFFKKCVLFGGVGFGEAYVDGDWDTDDITNGIKWMILNVENHPTLVSGKQKRSPVNLLKIFNNMLTPLRNNSINGSRKNIQAHYDLGNEFYELFLDPSMAYSAASFKGKDISLENAQYQKFDQLCRKIQLKKNDHLL